MNDIWDLGGLPEQTSPTDLCLHASHLLGRRRALILPGFGSTSVKITSPNLFGQPEQVLWISARGQDLERIDARGLMPLRTASLAALTGLESLSPKQYENALRSSCEVAAKAVPPPEATVHAILPGRYVFFSCPDALLAITHSRDWKERLHDLYAEELFVIESVGLDLPLARAVSGLTHSPQFDTSKGILVRGEGFFICGDEAREVYGRLLDLVSRAERYLANRRAWEWGASHRPIAQGRIGHELAALRQAASGLAGRPVLLCMDRDPLGLAFCQRQDLPLLSQKSAITPAQRAILRSPPRRKQDLAADGVWGQAQPDRDPQAEERSGLAPTVILDPEWGMMTAGRTAQEAKQNAEVYLHAIRVLLSALALGEYCPFPPRESGREAGLSKEDGRQEIAAPPLAFSGEIALVTGGASGIGRACVESLLGRGAAVASMDKNPKVKTLYDRPDYLGLECDLTDEQAVIQGFEALVRTFGGLDMLVLNAGVFPAGVRIESLDLPTWREVMRINLDSYLTVMREAYPLLKCSPRYGRVVLNASKNVLAPGAGAAAYSSSKAAVTQLARVAALEWGKDRIRVNTIHPDGIFDTGIWTEEVLEARAAHYGMTVEQYKTRNVLGVELNSRYVGELVAEMLGPLFEKITGAQIPVDGGSDRVI